MPRPIDRSGNFQAEITEYGLQEYDSGAKAVALKAKITAAWNPEAKSWDDWTGYEEVEASGYINIVKKDGSLNQGQVKALAQHAGWDGTFASISNEQWQPCPCQIVVNAEVYNDQKQYRISFVNAFDRTPGQVGNIDPDKAKQLDTQHGSTMRALLANVRRNGSAPPVSRPIAPPPKHNGPPNGNPLMPTQEELAEATHDLPF